MFTRDLSNYRQLFQDVVLHSRWKVLVKKNVFLICKHFTYFNHKGTMGEKQNGDDRNANTNNDKSIVHTNHLYTIFTLSKLLFSE